MKKFVLVVTILFGLLAQPLVSQADIETKVSAPYRIMFLGDSITAGIGVSNMNGARNYLTSMTGVSWLNPDLVGVCPQPTAPEWKCTYTPTMSDKEHSGFSGWRTDEIAARVPYLMDWYSPQTVLFMAGANDVHQQYDLANYANRVEGIIDTILTKRPGTHVFVALMTQFRDQRPIVDQLNNQLAVMLRTKDQRYVHMVYQNIVGKEPEKELYDHVHPNACGYARMAYVWAYYMEPVFSPGLNWPAEPNPFYDTTGPC
jgi:lysophospholipase L1-like esterase